MLMVAGLIATQPLAVRSQAVGTLEPRLGQTLVTLHQAESAGATPSEIEALVALLNKALELDNEALKLNAPDQAQRRNDLLAQVEQILTTVQNRATELAAVASQRTYNNRVLTYVGGAITAVLATFAYAFIVSFYQKYRIKRTFQMRVVPK
jgi:CHASE3 domain sensor protein